MTCVLMCHYLSLGGLTSSERSGSIRFDCTQRQYERAFETYRCPWGFSDIQGLRKETRNSCQYN